MWTCPQFCMCRLSLTSKKSYVCPKVLFYRFGYEAPFLFCIALTATDLLLRLILVERRNSPKEWFESSSEEDCDATLQEYTQEVNREKETTKEQIHSSLSLTYDAKNEEENRTKQKVENSIRISEDTDSNTMARTDNNNKENSNGKQGFKMTKLLLYPRFLTAVYVYFLSGMSYNIFEVCTYI